MPIKIGPMIASAAPTAMIVTMVCFDGPSRFSNHVIRSPILMSTAARWELTCVPMVSITSSNRLRRICSAPPNVLPTASAYNTKFFLQLSQNDGLRAHHVARLLERFNLILCACVKVTPTRVRAVIPLIGSFSALPS